MEEVNNNIPDEILEIILSLIPLKPRTRLKLVSKNWHGLITRIRTQGTPETTSYGLVVASSPNRFCPDANVMTHLLSVQDNGKDAIPLDSLNVTFTGLTLLASSNGLLLYAKNLPYSVCRQYHTEFMVYSPITKQCVWVPPLTGTGWISDGSYTGFVFDELSRHFKILCFTHRRTLTVWIFSSKTLEWLKFEKEFIGQFRGLKASTPLEMADDLYKISFTYDDGKKICLKPKSSYRFVVYDVEKHSFEEFGVGMCAFSWAGPDGKVYCCRCHGRLMVDICVMQDNGTWKITEHVIKLYNWRTAVGDKVPEQMIPSDDELRESDLYVAKPVCFNADLQTLYIQLHCMLFAYSLETKSLSLVWFDPEAPTFRIYRPPMIFSFLFKPVDISHLHLKTQVDS